jgi:hypothetical protein
LVFYLIGRGRRGGFRRGRGRGRFTRGIPFAGNFRRAYSPYSNYVNGRGGTNNID